MLAVALVVYIGLMGIHFVTGLSAFGIVSDTFVNDFSVRLGALLA